jgi:hypothetical protein
MLQPLCGNALEGVLGCYFLCGLLGFSLRHRVNASRQQLPRLGVAFSGLRQRNVRILAQGHELFLAVKPVCPTPQLSARWRNPEVKSASVVQTVGLFLRLGFFDFSVGQRHFVRNLRFWKIPPPQNKNTPNSTPCQTRLHLDASGSRKT